MYHAQRLAAGRNVAGPDVDQTPARAQASAHRRGGASPHNAQTLVKAADTMRDSGNLYLTWAKHYASVAAGNTDASSDEDETEDFDV